MILKTCNIYEFMLRCENKNVVCYGAGNWLNIVSEEFCIPLENVYGYVVDSNKKLWNTKKRVGCREIEIKTPQYLYDHVTEDMVVLITSGEHYVEIYEELETHEELNDVDCYIIPFLREDELDERAYSCSAIPSGFKMNSEPVIPATIHYTWFSGEPLPKGARKCMESWKRYAPDYEWKEWNSQNYDITSHPYVYEAIQRKKWGFAGDYVRLDVVYRYGGFYFDLDVELLRNIEDLRFNSAFCGFETLKTINLGSGFGAMPHHPVIRYLRDAYDNVHFIQEDGTMNLHPSPLYQTQSFRELGAQVNGQFQIVRECAIYPAIYFTPKDWRTRKMHPSEKSYSIHHFAGSWVEKKCQETDKKELLRKLAIRNENKYLR